MFLLHVNRPCGGKELSMTAHFMSAEVRRARQAINAVTHNLQFLPGDPSQTLSLAMDGAVVLAQGVASLRELSERFCGGADLLPEEVQAVRIAFKMRLELEDLQEKLKAPYLGIILRAIDRRLLGTESVLALAREEFYLLLGDRKPARGAWWAAYRDLDEDVE